MKQPTALLIAFLLIICSSVTVYADSAQPAYEAVERSEHLAATGSTDYLADVGEDGMTQIPKIEINTESGNGAALLKSDGYVNAQITVTDTDGSVLSGSVLFKVRGNSTAIDSIPKKAFTFKFDKKTDVLGMGKAKKWAMLANCFDPTLLRNYLVFDFAQELGIPYTSEQRFTELWLDGEYRGCYTVYEPIQAGATRVDIDVESNNGQKDFLLEYEASRTEDDVTYITAGGLRFAASDPDEPDKNQVSYITATMNDIVNTLKTGSEADIRRKIDIDSFAKFYLLNEYAKTADFGLSSVFFYYKDGVLYAGPPWDYDLALGNLNGDLSSSTKSASVSSGILQSGKNFYRWLCSKDWFQTEVKRVYAQHYDYIENISADGGLLDSLRAEYAELFSRNFSVWRVSRWWLNYQKVPLSTYDDNYRFLKTWCTERNEWLTEYYGLSRYDYVSGDADGNGEIEILDATLSQRVLALIAEDPDGLIALRAALSEDMLDITDVTAVQRFLADMETPVVLNERKSVMRY